MRKFIFLSTLLLHLLNSFQVGAISPGIQSTPDCEIVTLFTDRGIYIAGEKLQFSATISNNSNCAIGNTSKIIYIELITPDGNKLAASKCLVVDFSAQGCFTIPDKLITGIYFLRAYTKVMRNFGPKEYSYCQLRIINPGQNEVLAVENLDQSTDSYSIQKSNEEPANTLAIAIDHQEYSDRDTVFFSINSAVESANHIKSLCLSVVPGLTESAIFNPKKIKVSSISETEYFAESIGVSLTGTINETVSKKPVSDQRVNLSVIGDDRDFIAVRTDNTGRFFFSLPEIYGEKDIFLCCDNTKATEMKIWVDNDFCTLPVHIEVPAFSLSELERQVVLGMVANIRIKTHFQPDTLEVVTIPDYSTRSFYGIPTNVLNLDQYVQLPTIEEYFNELPGLVKVRKRNGEKYFKVFGSTDLSFYEPLVLIDWVALNEPAKILAIAPSNVARIEFVTKLYIKGDQTYGGIISIISKKGDFAGIDLPSAGMFINYRFLADNTCDEETDLTKSSYPDYRTTLFWNPNISMQEGMENKYSFIAPDTPGKYVIVIQGLTNEGEVFVKTQDFEVK